MDEVQDMHARVKDIHERLSIQHMSDHDLLIRVSTQLEGIATNQQEQSVAAMNQAAGIDARLRVLEGTRWLMLGAAGAIGTLGGLLARVLWH